MALVRTLTDNGMLGVEITYRTDVATEAIRRIRIAFPDIIIGTSAVLTITQVEQPIEAGADFIVSPGLNPSIV